MTIHGCPRTSFAVSYGIQFAAVTATITHTILYYRQPIAMQFSRERREPPDVHARLMDAYPRVPEWWYGVLFMLVFAAAVAVIKVWQTQMTVWALIVALLIAFVYVVPVGALRVHIGHSDQLTRAAPCYIGIIKGEPGPYKIAYAMAETCARSNDKSGGAAKSDYGANRGVHPARATDCYDDVLQILSLWFLTLILHPLGSRPGVTLPLARVGSLAKLTELSSSSRQL